MGIVSLKEDFAFKELMSNELVCKYFLAATLDIPVEEIRKVRVLNPILRRSFRKQKQGILDVLVEYNDDTKVNLEMQVVHKKNWKKRNIFYLSKMYVDDLGWGEDYAKLRRCICISVLDFDLTDNEKGHSVYRLRDKDGNDFTDVLELHVIELKKKFSEENELSDWVALFNATTEEELDMIKTANAGVQEGKMMVKRMSLGKRIRMELEAREKARRDRVAEDEYLRDQALEEGFEQGQLQLVASMVKEGIISKEEAAKQMHMTVEELERKIGTC